VHYNGGHKWIGRELARVAAITATWKMSTNNRRLDDPRAVSVDSANDGEISLYSRVHRNEFDRVVSTRSGQKERQREGEREIATLHARVAEGGEEGAGRGERGRYVGELIIR